MFTGDYDPDDIFVSAAHAGIHQGVKAEHLDKVWRIDIEQANDTLYITTQRSVRTSDPKLSRNYRTNDRMLRYKRIDEYFYMDIFFATEKSGKSTRQNICCQLFVTDRGFIYFVPMKSRFDGLQAVKPFAKQIGAQEAIISDSSKEQKSKELQQFLTEIGSTLRLLEENTPWSNKAELYIGIIKEAVRKEMKESDCPLSLWGYCLERRVRIHKL